MDGAAVVDPGPQPHRRGRDGPRRPRRSRRAASAPAGRILDPDQPRTAVRARRRGRRGRRRPRAGTAPMPWRSTIGGRPAEGEPLADAAEVDRHGRRAGAPSPTRSTIRSGVGRATAVDVGVGPSRGAPAYPRRSRSRSTRGSNRPAVTRCARSAATRARSSRRGTATGASGARRPVRAASGRSCRGTATSPVPRPRTRRGPPPTRRRLAVALDPAGRRPRPQHTVRRSGEAIARASNRRVEAAGRSAVVLTAARRDRPGSDDGQPEAPVVAWTTLVRVTVRVEVETLGRLTFTCPGRAFAAPVTFATRLPSVVERRLHVDRAAARGARIDRRRPCTRASPRRSRSPARRAPPAMTSTACFAGARSAAIRASVADWSAVTPASEAA